MPPSRDLEAAKKAYQTGDAEASKHAHLATAQEEHKTTQGKYIKSIIYGGLDGIITTFAVVAGVIGAALTPIIVLILGFANLIADGISMGIGDYLSSKSEREYVRDERRREAWEVKHFPEGEKREMIEIYQGKGIPEPDAKIIVETLARYEPAWIDVMMLEELGLIEDQDDPWRNGAVTFLSFELFGVIPLAAFILSQMAPISVLRSSAFVVAAVLTGITMFALGALKVKITGKSWLRSGLEMLLVGGLAATVAFLVGFLLSGLAI